MFPFKYAIDHIPLTTPHRRRQGIPMEWKYITIHDTGNPNSTARNERGWLTNPNNRRQASYHIVVDEKEAIECIPLNEVAWHAGDGWDGTGNRKTIGIELSETGDRQQTLINASILVASLLKSKNKGIEFVKQHNDWSGKNCPRLLRRGDGWVKFLEMIKKEIEKGEVVMDQWQSDMGKDGVYGLAEKGLLNSPENWAEEVGESTPNWLMFGMLNRLATHYSSEINQLKEEVSKLKEGK